MLSKGRKLSVWVLFLSVFGFSLWLGGCAQETTSNPTGSGGSTTDYGQYFVGSYNGASDVWIYSSGETLKNVSTTATISRSSSGDPNVIWIEMHANFNFNVYSIQVSSSTSFSGKYQDGKIRTDVSATRNGSTLTGTIQKFEQQTNGQFIAEDKATFTITKSP